MITERIREMLRACDGGDPPFPPTVLFNENWLLRLVVDWFTHHAEALRRVARPADRMDDLAFYLIAPQHRIDEGVFERDLAPEAIRRKVRRRVEEYHGLHDDWFRDWFEPTLGRIAIVCFSWEDL